MHMVAVAKAAGFILNWDDFSALSDVVPLLAKVYPNGPADVEPISSGWRSAVIVETVGRAWIIAFRCYPDLWLNAGLFHDADLQQGKLVYQAVDQTLDKNVIAEQGKAFSAHCGLKVVAGNLGRGVIKISAVQPENAD